MDWKRSIYIWQNSRRTNSKLQAVLKITLDAIWECSRAGKGINPASKITWVATGTAVWIKEGLCSRESSAPPVWCYPGCPQGWKGSTPHQTMGKGTAPLLQEPHTESRVRRREPRDLPTLWWKICLLLLPGAGDPGEGTDPWYSQWVPTGALVENSSGKAKAAANTPAEQAGTPYSKASNTSCLSCTVFTKIGCYL